MRIHDKEYQGSKKLIKIFKKTGTIFRGTTLGNISTASFTTKVKIKKLCIGITLFSEILSNSLFFMFPGVRLSLLFLYHQRVTSPNSLQCSIPCYWLIRKKKAFMKHGNIGNSMRVRLVSGLVRSYLSTIESMRSTPFYAVRKPI